MFVWCLRGVCVMSVWCLCGVCVVYSHSSSLWRITLSTSLKGAVHYTPYTAGIISANRAHYSRSYVV